MSERSINYEKLEKIYDLTSDGKYAVITFKDGYVCACKADCFGKEENGETNLLIETWDLGFRLKGGEVITGDQLESVEEYKPKK